MTKKECEKCKRILNKKCLRKHKVNGKLWCKRCFKTYGENAFFKPIKETRIGNFSMSEEEKQYLAKTKGWKGVSSSCKALNTIKKRVFIKRRKMKKEKLDLDKKKKEINKRFLEGLK